jgi:hypothetical protein
MSNSRKAPIQYRSEQERQLEELLILAVAYYRVKQSEQTLKIVEKPRAQVA